MELRQIIEQLKTERARIDDAINALEQVGGKAARRGRGARQSGPTRRKRRLTPEGRKRLSDMMKKRWAERKRRAKAA